MQQDCQFCSVISKANGEDPIGTAGTYDHWIITELPQPWAMEQWRQDPTVSPILALFEDLILNQGMRLRPIAIAPDRSYSLPGHTRLIYYRRPGRCFSQYEKQEYLVPTPKVFELTRALLQSSERLNDFDHYRQLIPTRDILVCTHGNVDIACSKFGFPMYQQLRQGAWARGSLGEPNPNQMTESQPSPYPSPPPPLRVWRCSHFGGHRFAPTLIDLPTGQFFGHLELHHLHALVHRQGEVAQLRPCYRGWAGLRPFEQMVERELWMQLGWPWLSYAKSGQILAQDESESPVWATVQIKFERPDGHSETYQADIELAGDVETASKSGELIKRQQVKQYRVSRCRLLKGKS